VLALALLLISGFATAGYRAPAVHDAESNLYDKNEDANKAFASKANQDMANKAAASQKQYSNKSKAADAKRFSMANAANKQKMIDKANREKNLKANSQDDIDKGQKQLKFKKDSLSKKNKQNQKKYRNIDNSADGKSSAKLNRNSKSKKHKNSNAGKSFANHEESDDDIQKDVVGDGNSNMDGRKHQQAHSFGNQYSDDDMSTSDNNNLASKKKNQVSKRNKATDFANNDVDQSTDGDSTDFGKNDANFTQRKNSNVDSHEAENKDKEAKKSTRANKVDKDAQSSRQKAKDFAAKDRLSKNRASKNADSNFANAANRKKKIIRDVSHGKE